MSAFETKIRKSERWNFYKEFDSKEQIGIILNELKMFYNDYRDTHSLSSRTWMSPIVYLDKQPVFYISVNGSFVRLDDEKLNKINEYNKLNSELPINLSQIR